ncbi:transposase [Halomonas piscis]|uniref:transposase n=1 Tax=Halomonas piscis TaxID=3031727 RepID=UPI0028938246|nr:transposase [Halomonas piscis]
MRRVATYSWGFVSIEVDWHCYQDRNLVERFFQKIKKFRRLSTRYERLARNYQSLLCLVSAAIWLA